MVKRHLRLKEKASGLLLSSGYLAEGLQTSYDVFTGLSDLPLYGNVDLEHYEDVQQACAQLHILARMI